MSDCSKAIEHELWRICCIVVKFGWMPSRRAKVVYFLDLYGQVLVRHQDHVSIAEPQAGGDSVLLIILCFFGMRI